MLQCFTSYYKALQVAAVQALHIVPGCTTHCFNCIHNVVHTTCSILAVTRSVQSMCTCKPPAQLHNSDNHKMLHRWWPKLLHKTCVTVLYNPLAGGPLYNCCRAYTLCNTVRTTFAQVLGCQLPHMGLPPALGDTLDNPLDVNLGQLLSQVLKGPCPNPHP